MQPKEAGDASDSPHPHGRVQGSKSSADIAGQENADGAAQPPAGGCRSARGTPSSNTVPNNSMEEGSTFFQAVRWGIDSLYLSYKGQVRSKVEDELQRLKTMAQSIEPLEVAKAQYAAGEHVFEVKDRGAALFPFILEDNEFRIQSPKHNSRSMPAAYVKVSSPVPLIAEKLFDLGSEPIKGLVDCDKRVCWHEGP